MYHNPDNWGLMSFPVLWMSTIVQTSSMCPPHPRDLWRNQAVSFTSVNSQPTVTAEYTAGLSVFTVKHITPQMHHSWTASFWFWHKMSDFSQVRLGIQVWCEWGGISDFPSSQLTICLDNVADTCTPTGRMGFPLDLLSWRTDGLWNLRVSKSLRLPLWMSLPAAHSAAITEQ